MTDNHVMAHCDKITSRDEATSRDEHVVTKPAPVPGSQRTAKWRAKLTQENERMRRIVAKAEALNAALNAAKGEQLSLPLSLVTGDVEQTLENLRAYIEQTEGGRELLRDQKQRRSTKNQRKMTDLDASQMREST